MPSYDTLILIPDPVTAQTLGAAPHSPKMMKGDIPMDMHGSMKNMQEQMNSMKSTGDTDYDFAAMMRIHHQGAVDMAEMEVKKGNDPPLKQMAKDIIAAEKKKLLNSINGSIPIKNSINNFMTRRDALKDNKKRSTGAIDPNQ